MSTIAPREVPLGGLRAMTVRRTLPNRERTTIGAWCFIDHYGPNRVSTDADGMFVAPHPHTGLQTVTWLFSGEVEHRDSVGSVQSIGPGEVNLMTAGSGISHSEVSTVEDGWLHGVQLWTVLPDADRHIAPFFEHHLCPRLVIDGSLVTVFVGELGDARAETTTFTDMLGAELLITPGAPVRVPARVDFEYGLLIDNGRAKINGEDVQPHYLAYIEPGVNELVIEASEPTRAILLGGVPFEEPIVMWWNFIARSHDEIEQMRRDWQSDVIDGGDPAGRFGHVDFDGPAIPAPEMPRVTLRARGGTRAG
jgi:redox-sensitive bicupin YhaK (pirin superfamily)